ncbi:ABC transporter ATP-binding protein [Thermodesulfobacteriota bacterium B35]
MRNYGYFEEGQIGSVRDLRLWRRILDYCRPHLAWLVGAVLLSLLVAGATLALPRLMQWAIDNYMVAPHLAAGMRVSGLGRTALFYGLLVAVVFVGGFVQVVVLEWVGQSIMHRMRQDLFVHIMDLDLAFFHDQPTGRLVTRLTNDIQNMHEMFTSVMVTLFNDFLKIAGILAILFWMNWRLALVMSVFVPLSIGSTVLFSRLARDRFRAIRSQLALLNSFLQESVALITVIQLFGRQKEALHRYGELNSEYLRRALSQVRLFGTFMPLTEFMGSAAVALILWYGGGEILRQRLTLGELVAFLSYMRLFFQPMRELSQKYSIVQSAMASAERIFQLLDTGPRITVMAPAWQEQPVLGDLRYDHVSFSYDRRKEAVREIDLAIRAGETVALVGATGSGKTTLVSLLLRFYDPDAGRILLDNTDLRHFPPRRLRRIIGIVTQDVFLLPDTVLANIVLDSGAGRADVEKLLDELGMGRFVHRLPEGLETRIGEGGLELSAGEKQLLCFARVMFRAPCVLVLDEATSSIDSASEALLEEAVARAFRGRTSLVIAHRLSTIQRVDRIVVLEHGRIVEQGSHEQLIAAGGVYSGLVHRELEGLARGSGHGNPQKDRYSYLSPVT